MLSFYYGDDCEEIQAGIDEAGRGCFSGPVVSAAVVWDVHWLKENANNYPQLKKIKDSKKVTQKNRNELFDFIKENAYDYSISFIDNNIIDDINILHATYKAMHTALDGIKKTNVNRILVDGSNFKTYYSNKEGEFVIPHTCITNGDNLYLSIASASILAKVSRDRYMEEICINNPEYNTKYDWINNKGYGTAKHIQGIKTYGITDLHRKTFGICKSYV
jgi:ribonuclease HII